MLTNAYMNECNWVRFDNLTDERFKLLSYDW